MKACLVKEKIVLEANQSVHPIISQIISVHLIIFTQKNIKQNFPPKLDRIWERMIAYHL